MTRSPSVTISLFLSLSSSASFPEPENESASAQAQIRGMVHASKLPKLPEFAKDCQDWNRRHDNG
jgi:hypothetical protein